jgi:hypothetical protein
MTALAGGLLAAGTALPGSCPVRSWLRSCGPRWPPTRAGIRRRRATPGCSHESGDSEPGDDDSGPGNGGGTGPREPSSPGGASGTRLAAQVIITVPFQAWFGQSSAPGEVGDFGLIDPGQVRDLLAAAARDRDSRSCGP